MLVQPAVVVRWGKHCMKLQWLVICIVIVLSLKSVDLVAVNLFFKANWWHLFESNVQLEINEK